MDNTLQTIRVLLVDDDEDDYIITRDLLNEIKVVRYQLEWVSSYKAAIEAIIRCDHEIYLFDYRLGENNGLELLNLAINNGCKVPIILLTGQGDHDVDVEATKAGASDYLIKGKIDADLLERSIRHAIDRKRAEHQIASLAYYDSLTNLPNRVLFKERLSMVLSHNQRHKRLAALFFLDIDNFKRINDTLGHTVGDIILKNTAERLAGCLRRSDSISSQNKSQVELNDHTIARFGGDEFIIVLSEIKEIENAAKVAQRIFQELLHPFKVSGHEIFISVSIGITIYPNDGEDLEALLKNADIAMYQAKGHGKNNYKYYKHTMNATAFERLTLENDLHRAMERGEFLMHYQPQFNSLTGKITGIEALVRWNHPKMGMIGPAKFIPVAEENNLIVNIGEWALRSACMHSKAWLDAGLEPVHISVNLSPIQFERSDIIKTIKKLLQESGFPPKYLVIEITETTIMRNADNAVSILRELAAMELKFALDDFGTGYSSLSYLRQFPFYALKIDKSFISDLTTNNDTANIVKAIIAMAHNLNKQVIAEGVETEEQLRFLYDCKCDTIQGYLHSKPMPIEWMTSILEKEKEGSGIGLLLHKKILESIKLPNCKGEEN